LASDISTPGRRGLDAIGEQESLGWAWARHSIGEADDQMTHFRMDRHHIRMKSVVHKCLCDCRSDCAYEYMLSHGSQERFIRRALRRNVEDVSDLNLRREQYSLDSSSNNLNDCLLNPSCISW